MSFVHVKYKEFRITRNYHIYLLPSELILDQKHDGFKMVKGKNIKRGGEKVMWVKLQMSVDTWFPIHGIITGWIKRFQTESISWERCNRRRICYFWLFKHSALFGILTVCLKVLMYNTLHNYGIYWHRSVCVCVEPLYKEQWNPSLESTLKIKLKWY